MTNDTHPLTDLKVRIASTGHRLLEDALGRLYILDPKLDQLIAVGLDEKTIERELEGLEQGAPDEGEAALDAIYTIAALVNVLADRLHGTGSLGVGDRGGHDHSLFRVLEREVAAAVRVAAKGEQELHTLAILAKGAVS